jgi:hypothetical protein
MIEDGESRSRVGDEDGEEACRFGGAGIFADKVFTPRRFEECFACLVDAGRPLARDP